jgi:hypothetical protein
MITVFHVAGACVCVDTDGKAHRRRGRLQQDRACSQALRGQPMVRTSISSAAGTRTRRQPIESTFTIRCGPVSRAAGSFFAITGLGVTAVPEPRFGNA